jgi:hypothetical protein
MRILAVFLVIGIPIAGCSTTQYVATSQPFCAAVKTVCISKADQMSESTASQVEANNLGWAKVCKRRVVCKSTPTP